MNEEEFAEQMASVITKYIQGKFEFCDEALETKTDNLKRLRILRDSKNYRVAILEILENPLFELAPNEISENADKVCFCERLYLNISKLYEELKILSDCES